MARKVVWIVVFGIAVLSLCAIAYGEDAAYFSSKKTGTVQMNPGDLTTGFPDASKTPSPAGPILKATPLAGFMSQYKQLNARLHRIVDH